VPTNTDMSVNNWVSSRWSVYWNWSSLFTLSLTAHTRTKKKDLATIIKIQYYCFGSFVVPVIFVNILYSSYLHFQKKLDNIMQECINAHITLQFLFAERCCICKSHLHGL
jgi:hypothetical protein